MCAMLCLTALFTKTNNFLAFCCFFFVFVFFLDKRNKGSNINPIAVRKAKIVYNFGLSECNRVKGKNLLQGEHIISFKVDPY